MPDNVIRRIEALGRRDRQLPAVTFTDCNGDPFGDDQQDDYAPADHRGRTGVDENIEQAARGQRALFELPGVFQGPLEPDQLEAPQLEPLEPDPNHDDKGAKGNADKPADDDIPAIQPPPPQLPPQVINVDKQAEEVDPVPLAPLEATPVDNISKHRRSAALERILGAKYGRQERKWRW